MIESGNKQIKEFIGYDLADLPFHDSVDFMLPVLREINKRGFTYAIKEDSFLIFKDDGAPVIEITGDNTIMNVWYGLVRFINYYELPF